MFKSVLMIGVAVAAFAFAPEAAHAATGQLGGAGNPVGAFAEFLVNYVAPLAGLAALAYIGFSLVKQRFDFGEAGQSLIGIGVLVFCVSVFAALGGSAVLGAEIEPDVEAHD